MEADRLGAMRPRLVAYCYRLLGSIADAEDVAQTAIERAWTAQAGFAGRSSFETWVHTIATRCCLDELRRRPRRAIPAGLGVEDELTDAAWIEPLPTPDGAVERQERVSLAFVAALQRLPPRQRAAVVLADVLDWPAVDIARGLDTTVSAVRSALVRGRSTLRGLGDGPALAPDDERVRDLARRLADAFERGDAEALAGLLAADAILSMPPERRVVRGAAAIVTFFVGTVWPRRTWRLVPTRANGTLAFAIHADGHPHAVQVVHLAPDGAVASLVVFRFPELVRWFEG